MTRARFILGRALVHLGLHCMPPGRVRSDLFGLIDQWASRVRDEIARARTAQALIAPMLRVNEDGGHE